MSSYNCSWSPNHGCLPKLETVSSQTWSWLGIKDREEAATVRLKERLNIDVLQLFVS
jgi:hypothetical protein